MILMRSVFAASNIREQTKGALGLALPAFTRRQEGQSLVHRSNLTPLLAVI